MLLPKLSHAKPCRIQEALVASRSELVALELLDYGI